MKKKKVNLPKLALNKHVISNLSQEKVIGGVTGPNVTCLKTCIETCRLSCFCTEISQAGDATCFIGCNTTMVCP